MDTLFKYNNIRGELLSNQKIQKVVGKVIEETEAEFKRNYNKIMCDTSYQYPILKKNALTINDSVYYESYENIYTISDSRKQVDARNEPIKETHIVDRVRNLSVGVGSVKPSLIGVGIIVQGITQGIINGGTSISSNLVTDVLTDSSKILFDTNTFHFNKIQPETLVIGTQDESTKINNRIICKLRIVETLSSCH